MDEDTAAAVATVAAGADADGVDEGMAADTAAEDTAADGDDDGAERSRQSRRPSGDTLLKVHTHTSTARPVFPFFLFLPASDCVSK